MFIRVPRVAIHGFQKVKRLELDLASVEIDHAKVLGFLISGVSPLKDVQANKSSVVRMVENKFLHGYDKLIEFYPNVLFFEEDIFDHIMRPNLLIVLYNQVLDRFRN